MIQEEEKKKKEIQYSPFLAESAHRNLLQNFLYIHMQRHTDNMAPSVCQSRLIHACRFLRLRLRLVEMVVVVMVLVMVVVFVSLHHLRQAAFVKHDAGKLPHLLLLHHRS